MCLAVKADFLAFRNKPVESRIFPLVLHLDFFEEIEFAGLVSPKIDVALELTLLFVIFSRTYSCLFGELIRNCSNEADEGKMAVFVLKNYWKIDEK